jgi:hypothetical protein
MDIRLRGLPTPGGPSTVRTPEPSNCEDIFFAECNGVIGSRVLPIINNGVSVLFAPIGPVVALA